MGVTEGGILSRETKVKEGSFEMFPKEGAISYLEVERVPKSRCVLREGIREMFV